MATSGHECLICLNHGGLRYCKKCLSVYICTLCRARLAQDERQGNQCPQCRRKTPPNPLDCALIDALPAVLDQTLPYQPEVQMIAFEDRWRGILPTWITGIRVGIGHADTTMRDTEIYCAQLPGEKRLGLFFLPVTVTLEKGKELGTPLRMVPAATTLDAGGPYVVWDKHFSLLEERVQRIRIRKCIQRVQAPLSTRSSSPLLARKETLTSPDSVSSDGTSAQIARGCVREPSQSKSTINSVGLDADSGDSNPDNSNDNANNNANASENTNENANAADSNAEVAEHEHGDDCNADNCNLAAIDSLRARGGWMCYGCGNDECPYDCGYNDSD